MSVTPGVALVPPIHRAVGGPVVDHHDLELARPLGGEQVLEAAIDEPGVVPAEDDGPDPLDPLDLRLDHRRIVRGERGLPLALEGGADALLDGLEALSDERADDVERAAGLLGLCG